VLGDGDGPGLSPHVATMVIVDPDYGRAYADAIPLARFQLLPGTGHLPQLETPEQLMKAIWDRAVTEFSGQPSGESRHSSCRP
jgi:pimeloyl-ACP methyl ester carboxylesterase